jgi:hypothetical protein
MVFSEDECARAGQRLRQGAQVFFLNEIAMDHIGFGQLITELLQIECLRPRRATQHQYQRRHDPVAAAEPARLRSAAKPS